MHKEGFSLIAVGQCLYGLHDLLLRIGKVFVNRLHRCTELFGLLLIEQRHVAAAAGCMQHCSNLCALPVVALPRSRLSGASLNDGLLLL